MPTNGPLTEEQQQILKAFEQSLTGDGKAPRTIQSYLSDVIRFINFQNNSGNKNLAQINRTDMTSFRQHMLQQGFQPATINKRIVQ